VNTLARQPLAIEFHDAPRVHSAAKSGEADDTESSGPSAEDKARQLLHRLNGVSGSSEQATRKKIPKTPKTPKTPKATKKKQKAPKAPPLKDAKPLPKGKGALKFPGSLFSCMAGAL